MKIKKNFHSIGFFLILISFAVFLQKPAVAQKAEEYFKLGRDCYNNRDIDKAKSFFEKALELNHGYAKAWCELAVCYMEKGNFEKAVELLKQSLKLAPNSPKANYAIAVAYVKEKEPDIKLARKYYNKAKKLGYNIPEWFLSFLEHREKEVKEYE